MTTTVSNAQMLSLPQAAALLGLSVRTLRRRIAAGDLPAYRSGRSILRVRSTDLDQLFKRVPAAR